MIPIGFTLQPNDEFLDLCELLILEDADYYEVAPETLWRESLEGRLAPNGFHRRFLALKERTRRPFVAHGVALSMGTADAKDAARRRRWLAQVKQDHRAFSFRWYTDHLGATSLAGLNAALPLPLPMTAEAAGVVRRRLRAMQRVVPDVGVENNVAYFCLGDPLEEPAFLGRITAAARTWILLDLHNLATMAVNFGFDAREYLEALDLSRIIEIHLSGGKQSEPGWLPERRTMRLDSHDDAVPDAVWKLYSEVVSRCPRLKGVTLERMEGTVAADDVPLLRSELRQARRIAAGAMRRGRG